MTIYSGHLSGNFAFAHGVSPDLSFCPFEKGGKRDTQRLEESWVICNQTFASGGWGFTIADFWYIIFLTPYNEKVCGIAVLIVFHVDYFAGFCDITVSLNMLDAVFLIFGSIFDLV